MPMLSNRFTSKEALIIAEKAADTLDAIDKIIETDILNGKIVSVIMIYDNNIVPNGDYTNIGKVFREAVDFFINHYERRNFIVKYEGRYLEIRCPKK